MSLIRPAAAQKQKKTVQIKSPESDSFVRLDDLPGLGQLDEGTAVVRVRGVELLKVVPLNRLRQLHQVTELRWKLL